MFLELISGCEGICNAAVLEVAIGAGQRAAFQLEHDGRSLAALACPFGVSEHLKPVDVRQGSGVRTHIGTSKIMKKRNWPMPSSSPGVIRWYNWFLYLPLQHGTIGARRFCFWSPGGSYRRSHPGTLT